MENSPRLQGIIVPMITPLRARDQIDHPGLDRLIEHILAGGVHGLFILGTSGEAPSLSHRLRRELVSLVCEKVGERVPVLVGITDTSFVETVDLAQHAADSGAAAVVTAPPYYLPISQPELAEYVEQLVAELPVPLFLYNMPQVTKVIFEVETVRCLASIEKIAGIKDSSGDLTYFDQLIGLKSIRPDWSVLVGPENLMAETVRRGGDGGVNGGANVYPRLLVDLYDAVKRGDARREAELQTTLLQLGKIFSVGRHASAVIKGMKCACSLLGLCSDEMAEPFARFNPPEREKVQAILASLNIQSELAPT
ncbi:MAG: dihydrodipicolinate synthase family protein [Verrucomicrobiota bacterium]